MEAVSRTRRTFTADEVLRMVEAGILREDEPVELIDGELVQMAPQGPLHRARTVVLHRILQDAFGAGHHVQAHSPVDAGPNSLPEPDLAVVRGAPEAFEARHPAGGDVPLVVELSVTSQAEDRAKAHTYAAGGFPVYWNLDLAARRLTVYAEPRPDRAEYAVVRTLTEHDEVEAGGARLRVGDLLPG